MNKVKREVVYNKFKGKCAYCGEGLKYEHMQVDHIVPKSNYELTYSQKHIKCVSKRIPRFLRNLTTLDVDHIDNLFPSCRKCNNFKSTFYLELFRNELQLQLERANKTSRNYRLAKQFGQVKETPKPIKFYFETLKQ